jgi:hypothetical protein
LNAPFRKLKVQAIESGEANLELLKHPVRHNRSAGWLREIQRFAGDPTHGVGEDLGGSQGGIPVASLCQVSSLEKLVEPLGADLSGSMRGFGGQRADLGAVRQVRLDRLFRVCPRGNKTPDRDSPSHVGVEHDSSGTVHDETHGSTVTDKSAGA